MRCSPSSPPTSLLVSDAGGVGKAPVRPIAGEDKVGRFLIGVTTKVEPGTTVGLEVFNGRLGLVARLDGRAITAIAFDVGPSGQVQHPAPDGQPGEARRPGRRRPARLIRLVSLPALPLRCPTRRAG